MSVHRGDTAGPEDCRRTVAQVVQQHGRLDILVNDAGITVDRTVLEMADADWRRVIDVNLSGAFSLSQAALKHMLERGTGRRQRSGKTDGIGVTVNAVTPGYTATELLGSVPEKDLDGLRAKISLGRLGEPEQVARVVRVLAADASAPITGQL